jgi:hypothetical protein
MSHNVEILSAMTTTGIANTGTITSTSDIICRRELSSGFSTMVSGYSIGAIKYSGFMEVKGVNSANEAVRLAFIGNVPFSSTTGKATGSLQIYCENDTTGVQISNDGGITSTTISSGNITTTGTITSAGVITASAGVKFVTSSIIQTSAYTGYTTGASVTNASITIDTNGKITAISSGTTPAAPGLAAVLAVDNAAEGKDITGVGTITATKFDAQSDYRIKENIEHLNDSYNVDNLKPVTYFNTKSEKQDIGLIAHELQEIYPELVTGEKDGEDLQSINYIGLIPILIKEIQDLKKNNIELTNQLLDLKKVVEKLLE